MVKFKTTIVIIGFFFCWVAPCKGQNLMKDNLRSLSLILQKEINKNGIKLSQPITTFSKIGNQISWSSDSVIMRKFDSDIRNEVAIQDSFLYEIRNFYDAEENQMLIDVYKGYGKINETLFINLGVNAIFKGGMKSYLDKFSQHLSPSYFESHSLKDTLIIAMGNVKDSLLGIYGNNKSLVDETNKFWKKYQISHRPAIYYGKPIFNTYSFEIKSNDGNYEVDCVEYEEYLFATYADNSLYMIKGMHTGKADEWSFVYDRKSTWCQFLERKDVQRVIAHYEKKNINRLLKILFESKNLSRTYSVILLEK
jgi:hypothetical protein